jgi:SH3-like domain-containing protein
MTQLSSRVPGFLAVLALALPLSAQGVDHVSVAKDNVNLRAGPGTHHAAEWKLSQGYPLQVVRRQGSWIKVRDYEGDQGWIYRSLTHAVPHHVVKAERANLRAGPGTRHALITTLEQGEVLKTHRKAPRWVKVETSDGLKGWVARSLLWGW